MAVSQASHPSDNKDKITFEKQSSRRGVSGNSPRFNSSCRFWVSKSSPGRFWSASFLKHIGSKVATALRLLPLSRRPPAKVSSSESSKSFVNPVDSQRTEAIQDCIEFINSTSLQRTNSVAAKSS